MLSKRFFDDKILINISNMRVCRCQAHKLIQILFLFAIPGCSIPQTYVEAEGVSACESNCGGHEAGWRWARKRHISNPASCGGNSRSFMEGCAAYARDVGE